MKRILFIIAILVITKGVVAQTNVIHDSGNVGIGNSSPTALLQIGSGIGDLHISNPQGILFKSGSGAGH